MKPCPLCQSTDIVEGDCGYSSFNPTWCECQRCGFKVAISFTSGDVNAPTWEKGVEVAVAFLKAGRSLAQHVRKLIGIEETYQTLLSKRKKFSKEGGLKK